MTCAGRAAQAGAVLEFDVIQNNEATAVTLEQTEVVIGRRNENREVHLDLTPDDLVSRVHARVWLEGNAVSLMIWAAAVARLRWRGDHGPRAAAHRKSYSGQHRSARAPHPATAQKQGR